MDVYKVRRIVGVVRKLDLNSRLMALFL